MWHHVPCDTSLIVPLAAQGGEINFLQYLEAVERTQLNTFVQSSVGKAQLAKAGKAAGRATGSGGIGYTIYR